MTRADRHAYAYSMQPCFFSVCIFCHQWTAIDEQVSRSRRRRAAATEPWRSHNQLVYWMEPRSRPNQFVHEPNGMEPRSRPNQFVHTGACRRHCYLLDFVYQEQNQRARSKHDTLLVFLLAEFRNHDRGRRRRRCFLLVADGPEGDRDQCNTMRLLTFFRTHDVASCGELPAAFGAAEQQPDGEGFVMGS